MEKIVNSFTGDVEYTVGKNFIANFDYQGGEIAKLVDKQIIEYVKFEAQQIFEKRLFLKKRNLDNDSRFLDGEFITLISNMISEELNILETVKL